MPLRTRFVGVLVGSSVLLTLITAGCGKPGVNDLRDSFAQQLAANKFVKDFQKNGDDLRFTGPGGRRNRDQMARAHRLGGHRTDQGFGSYSKPYKGTVKSSWYAGDYKVMPDPHESNLPLELISTGLAQDCWAAWNKTTNKWEW